MCLYMFFLKRMANYLIVRKNSHQKGNPKIPYMHFTFSHIVNNIDICKTLLRFLICIMLVHTRIYFALGVNIFGKKSKLKGIIHVNFTFRKYLLF